MNRACLTRPYYTGSSGGGALVLDDGRRVEYDWLVVAVGTATSDIGVPGAKERAIPLSTLADAQRMAEAMRGIARKTASSSSTTATAATTGPAGSRGRVAVVGSGLAGVELAGVVAERLRGAADVELMASSDGGGCQTFYLLSLFYFCFKQSPGSGVSTN